jgi:sarcosine oxidase
VKVAVIGAGVVGLSISVALRDLGADVSCFEKATPMSERSAGGSRIFRYAHTNPELVRFAQRARAGFDRWAETAATPLIDASECVITGADLAAWASAMRDAEAPFSIVGADSERVRLPSRDLPSELLIDHSGGVIDVEAVGTFLIGILADVLKAEAVYGLEHRTHGVGVQGSAGTYDFDRVIVAAGSGTSSLAVQVGLYTPSSLAHHVRFTFPMHEPIPLQCWIDKPEVGLSTYQHLGAPGEWSIGGQVDLARTTWEVGPDQAIAASRDLVLRYVRDRLHLVDPRIIGQLYCTTTPGHGDGFTILRYGDALAVYGENLFKHAPALGDLVARAALDEPTSDEATTVYAV